MGQGELFALDAGAFRRLLESCRDGRLMDVVDEIESGWPETDRLLCWKSWPELHKCFTGSVSDPTAGLGPLPSCFLGSQHLSDPNGGYIVAILPTANVAVLATALAVLDVNWLRRQCERLFPNGTTEEWITALAEMLATVQRFYQAAAASQRSVLFTSDEILDDIYPRAIWHE